MEECLINLNKDDADDYRRLKFCNILK